MAKSRAEKEQIVEELVDKINNSKSIVFANFQGLTVDQSEQVRAKCREEEVEFKASKKTLLKLALKEAGMEDIDPEEFDGGVAAIFGKEDQVAPARITADFAKDFDPIKIFGGVLEEDFVAEDKVKALAELPSKQQLRGQVVGAMNAPVSGFVNVLNSNVRGLVQVLDSIKDQKES